MFYLNTFPQSDFASFCCKKLLYGNLFKGSTLVKYLGDGFLSQLSAVWVWPIRLSFAKLWIPFPVSCSSRGASLVLWKSLTVCTSVRVGLFYVRLIAQALHLSSDFWLLSESYDCCTSKYCQTRLFGVWAKFSQKLPQVASVIFSCFINVVFKLLAI